jgi:hypothetical protein
MPQNESTQSGVEALNAEFQTYVERVKQGWRRQNQVNSRDVYEVMRPSERSQVHFRMAEWVRYITPLAEDWWKERGYRVEWPENDSEPMKVFSLETS